MSLRKRKPGIRLSDGSIVRFKRGKRYQYEPYEECPFIPEKPLQKKLPCLCCGKLMLTILSIRICQKCKTRNNQLEESDIPPIKLGRLDGRGTTDAASE